MPSGFTDPFRYYLPPNDEVIKSAMTSGLIVPDTNVLLSAYRFAPAAREELLSVLARISDRIWVPNRVAEEFHRNRLSVINDHDSAYISVIEGLRQAQQNLDDDVRQKISELANRTALSDDEKNRLFQLVAMSTGAATSAVEKLRKNHGLIGPRDQDPILARLEEFFDGKVGAPFSDQELEAAIAEARRRIEHNIPPGYRDKKKDDPYAWGDYFIWKQSMLEVTRRQASYLVFVTTDSKEDWYQKLKGRTIGARPELVKELMNEAGAQLVMLSTASFLFHAREHLNAEISPETIRQSEELVPEKVLAHNERAKLRQADLDRLARRISDRRVLIETIEATLESTLEEDPEGSSSTARSLQHQLADLRYGERILRRRLHRLQNGSMGDVRVVSGQYEDAQLLDEEEVDSESD
jgi:hypothetical protein